MKHLTSAVLNGVGSAIASYGSRTNLHGITLATGHGRPTISVVIPTYNRADFVGRAVRSALDQSMPAHEVIVVDDASTDDTLGELARFGDQIRVLRSEQNIERGAARNWGAREATGEYLAFLDSDDVWTTEKLQAQSPHLRRGAMCLTEVLVIDERGNVLSRPRLRRRRAVRHVRTRNLFFGSPSSMVIEAAAFRAVGGFQEDRRVQGSEDWLFLVQATQAGIEIDVVHEPLVRYLVHDENSMGDPNRMAAAMWSAVAWLERNQANGRRERAQRRTWKAVAIARQYAGAKQAGEAARWTWRAFRGGSPPLALALAPRVLVSLLRALRRGR